MSSEPLPSRSRVRIASPRHAPMGGNNRLVRDAALAAEITTRRIGSAEEDGCRRFLQEQELVSEVPLERSADKNWERTSHRRTLPEASSWLHPLRGAAVSTVGTSGSGRSLPWDPEHQREWNSASPRSEPMRIPQPKRAQHAKYCAVDFRSGLAMAFQERFKSLVVFNI